MSKCPGQNLRFWGAGDIFDLPCPQCGRAVEFFKDDSRRSCQGCGKVLICACEEQQARTFLPHQISFGRELESQQRVPVDGFAPRICAECRGETEELHPVAEIWGRKGKVERFYWREIRRTYYALLLEHYDNRFPFRSIVEHDIQCPEFARNRFF